jgi:hypothetical protein
VTRPARADLDDLTTGVFGTTAVSAGDPSRRPHQNDLVVVQWQGRPRMLIPRTGRRAAAGIVSARPRLARPKEARLRTVLGATLLTGLPQAGLGRRGVVVPGGSAGGPAELLEALRTSWDRRVFAVGFSVRPVTANHKPTFVAVDRSGEVLGFGKLSADAGARARLDAEAEALAAMAADPVPGLHTPRVLATFAWSAARVLVVEPIPKAARRSPNQGPAPLHLLRHAATRGVGLDVVERAAELAGAISASGPEEHAHAAAALVEHLRARVGGITSAAARAHGDLVPWNVATEGAQTWLWDWEHSRARDVVALDVLHWHVQIERHVLHQSVLAAHATAEPVAARQLVALGLESEELTAVRWLARLLVVERWATLGQLLATTGRDDPERGLGPELIELLTWR